MIIFKDWKLRYIGDLLARQNDNLSRLLLVEGVPDGYDWVMKVQVQLNGRRDIIPLRKMDGGVGVVLDKNQLAYAGYYSLQLMGTLSSDGVTTRHTNQLRVYIGPSLAGGGDWPEVPSEYTQFEDRLRELNQHPPVPGPNGYWMIWNTEADKYEESDFVLPSGEDDDPVTPESIGAIPSSDKGKAGGVATLDSSGKVPSGQIPSLEYAAKTHASTHATSGSDPITPASIGAASKNLVESDLLVPKDTEDPASYLDNLLDEYIATKPNGSLGYVKIQFQVVHPTLGGGQYIASVFVIMQDYVSIEAIAYASGTSNNIVRKYTRSKSNGVWGEWTAASTASSGESSGTPSAHASTHATGGSDPITPASIGAAPDGYGLGAKTGKLITDGNDALVGGWFYWGNIDTNLPFTYGHLRVDPRLMGQTSGKQTLMQTAYSDNYQGCVAQRKMVDGAFKPWEWVNPPMVSGTEYRTTERHLGNPVYKKMDSNGVIWWSTDQSTWKREAERVGAALSTHASQHATNGSDPITPASIGAAPAGYGLGGIGKRVTDMNNAQESGFYSALGASNLPPNVESVQYGSVLVLCSQADRVTQVYFQDVTGGTGPIAVRRLNGNGWSDWEFINPPMKSGIEYRTTERHLGNPVYKKMDSNGVIWWSTDQSTWKREAERVGAAPSTHASQHASGGSDPITPASIGAMAAAGNTKIIEQKQSGSSDVGWYRVLCSNRNGAANTALVNIRHSYNSSTPCSILALVVMDAYAPKIIVLESSFKTGNVSVSKLRLSKDEDGNVYLDYYYGISAVNYVIISAVNMCSNGEITLTDFASVDDTPAGETVLVTQNLRSIPSGILPVATTVAVTLSASAWNSSAKTQTTTVSGVLADETKQLITPTPAMASQDAYYNAGIRCTGQSADKLTFTAKTIPTADLTVYVTIQEVGA